MSSTPPWLAASSSTTSSDPGPFRRQRDARLTDAARIRRRPLLAVQRTGQDPGRRRLAAAARTGEQVGVIDPAGRQRGAERFGDVLLPHHLGEGRGSVLAIESERHGTRLRQQSDTLAHRANRTEGRIGRSERRGFHDRPHDDLPGDERGPPHPPELTDPCCLPALGGLMRWTPRGSGDSLTGFGSRSETSARRASSAASGGQRRRRRQGPRGCLESHLRQCVEDHTQDRLRTL